MTAIVSQLNRESWCSVPFLRYPVSHSFQSGSRMPGWRRLPLLNEFRLSCESRGSAIQLFGLGTVNGGWHGRGHAVKYRKWG